MWIRPYQLAKQLKVTRQTIYRWIREGKMKHRVVEVKVKRLEVWNKD